MKRLLPLLGLALALAGCTDNESTPVEVGSPNGQFTLTVLHNNDAGSNLLDGTVERFATLVKSERNQARARGGSLLLAGGNNLDANPAFQASRDKGSPYYETLAMQLLGYDASGIGFSEFYFGPDVFATFLQGFSPGLPFLSANLNYQAEPGLQALVGTRLARSTTVRVLDQDVGLVGVTTETLSAFSTPRGVTASAAASAAQGAIDQLRQNGVNKILVVGDMLNLAGSRALARQLRGADAMVMGTSGEVLANPTDLLQPGDKADGPYPLMETDADGQPVPIVVTGAGYRYLGRLILRFDAQGNLLAVDPGSGPLRVDGTLAADPEMRSQVVEPLAAAVQLAGQQVVGSTQIPLRGLEADLRSRETNEGDLVADALLWQAQQLAGGFGQPQPQVAFLNGGAIRNKSILPIGSLTQLDLTEMLPFASFVVIIPDVSAATLKELLENAVSGVEHDEGRFAQVAGLRFTWDPAGTPQQKDDQGNVTVAGTRIREVTLTDNTVLVSGGAVAPAAPSIDLATLDFLARGGDGYPFHNPTRTALGVSYQEALLHFLTTALGGVVPAAAYPDAGTGRITRL